MLPINCSAPNWLALAIGNSRCHWASFQSQTLLSTWETPHLSKSEVEQLSREGMGSELWIASVVPAQTALWQDNPIAQVIQLEQVPLQGLYPTLGIDRALAVLGAGEKLGYPVLVIDAGTALTFTGVDGVRSLVGGAILPGLGLQLQSLFQKTAQLPEIQLPEHLPDRWTTDTVEAIQSGVLYTVLSGIHTFIQDWWQKFPGSAIGLTGGDAAKLYKYLQVESAAIVPYISVEPDLIVTGISIIQKVS